MKITQRDKILLLVLVMLLVVALVVVLPGVGVMSCNEKISEIDSNTAVLEGELDELLATLKDMGIEAAYAESSKKAREKLEEKTHDMKVEASHLAGSIMVYAKPYAVDEEWVDGLEYRYGVKSDEAEKIVDYSPIKDVDSADNGNDRDIPVGDETISLPTATREIRFTVSEDAACDYETALTIDKYDPSDLGAALLFLQHITSKGSMLINEFYCYTGETRSPSVNFTLLMPPEGSGISTYATEIAEEAEENGEEAE